MLIPCTAILAEAIVAFRVLRQRAIALICPFRVIPSRRRDPSTCHSLHPLPLLTLLTIPTLTLGNFPWPADRAAFLSAVKPVHWQGRTWRHLMPWLAVDGSDAAMLLDCALALELMAVGFVGRISAWRVVVQADGPATALREQLMHNALVLCLSLEPLVICRSEVMAVSRPAMRVWVGAARIVHIWADVARI